MKERVFFFLMEENDGAVRCDKVSSKKNWRRIDWVGKRWGATRAISHAACCQLSPDEVDVGLSSPVGGVFWQVAMQVR